MEEEIRLVRARPRRRLPWLWLLPILVLACVAVAVIRMHPLLVNIATARASNTVNRIIVAAVSDALRDGKISYDALVTLEKDANGRVTALKSNMAEANRLQSDITDDVLQRLNDTATRELNIPIGTLTGSALLAGRGPSLSVMMQTVGSCTAEFRNEFSTAGINQTKHEILLDINVNISVLLPGFRTSTKVSNTVAVAETVIVGDVPETYTYFDNDDEEEPDDLARDYIMNKG